MIRPSRPTTRPRGRFPGGVPPAGAAPARSFAPSGPVRPLRRIGRLEEPRLRRAALPEDTEARAIEGERGGAGVAGPDLDGGCAAEGAVSYTHLTLPTNR